MAPDTRTEIVNIVRRDGNLYQSSIWNPDAKLVSIGHNRYKLEGLPDGFFSNFSIKDGKIQLLLEQPQGPVLLQNPSPCLGK